MTIKFDRALKITVVLIFFVTLFFKINYKPVSACTCAPPSSPREEKERSAAVFSGTVVNINYLNSNIQVNFQVQQIWQGEIGDTVTITTPNNSGACGVYFKPQERYLVYAYNSDRNQLTTDLCSRTKLFSRAGEDLKELGPASLPGEENLGILNNSSWQLERFNEEKIRTRTNITAFFEYSQISGNAGCNFYKANYQEKGNSIEIDQFILTKRNCTGEIAQRENNYLQALTNAEQFQIDRGRLTIYYYDSNLNQGKLVYARTLFR